MTIASMQVKMTPDVFAFSRHVSRIHSLSVSRDVGKKTPNEERKIGQYYQGDKVLSKKSQRSDYKNHICSMSVTRWNQFY